jgi:hypothetical protein
LCQQVKALLSGAGELPLTTVILADLSPMLENVVSNVLKPHFDLRVIRRTSSGCALLNEAVEVGAPIVVVAQDDPSDLAAVSPCLANAARVSVVAIAPDGVSACLHTFKPVGRDLADVSAEQIVAAIADAVAANRS